MKIGDICEAFISGWNLPDADADKIRERIVNDLIEISTGRTVSVHYSLYGRFISVYQYDQLMQLDRDRIRIAAEGAELKRIQNLYAKDVKSYLEAYLSRRIPDYSLWHAKIKKTAENIFRKEVSKTFDMKAIMEFAKDSGEANPLIFLAETDGSTGSFVVDSMGIRDLVAAIRSNSESIEL